MGNYSSFARTLVSEFAAVVFVVLFVVFLVKSIIRGNRVKELEKELKRTQDLLNLRQDQNIQPGNPYIYQEQNQINQRGVQAGGIQQPAAAQPVPSNAVQPVQDAAVQAVQQVVTQPVQIPPITVENAMMGQAPAYQPAAPLPVPSAAAFPAQEVQRPELPVYTKVDDKVKPHREKFFSSINITFGIGVLLLTIVGATFMTGSWSWMTEEIRAVSLIVLVVLVYGMSFLAGKVLKLQQTGFALYSLASLLGPIVIVGMGTFNLLGPGFSFENGSGWFVASVASLVLLLTAIGGRFLFREKSQTNIYRGTIYISLTWLVVFLAGQIGQASGDVTEWGMIVLGLATLALAFRIVGIIPLFDDQVFFKVYSEIITYIPAVLILFSIAEDDGAVFGAAIVEFIALVMLARFAKGRRWARFITPLAGLEIVISWLVFSDSFSDPEEMYMVTAVMMVIFFAVYVIHKVMKISSFASDIGIPVVSGTFISIVAVEDVPVMGAVACFLTILMLVYRMAAEPVLAGRTSLPEGYFCKETHVPMQSVMSVFCALFYYTGAVFIYFVPENNPVLADLYFTLAALIPAVAAVAARFALKEDIRLYSAGLTLSVISVTAGFFSIFSYSGYSHSRSIFCDEINICAWILTLAVITLCVFFAVGSLKAKKVTGGAMFWISLCLNALSIGVFLMIENFSQRTSGLVVGPDEMIHLARKIAALAFLGLNIGALAVTFFIRRRGKEDLISAYSAGLKYFFCGFSMWWFFIIWIIFDASWGLLIAGVVTAVLLSLLDAEFFAVLPVLAAEVSVIYELRELGNRDLTNVLLIAAAILVAGAGRLIFRKAVASSKAIDYLSFTSFIFMLGLYNEDYVPMMVFLASSLLVMNFANRCPVSVRILLSGFAGLICMAVITQPFFTIPDLISLEYDIALLLGALLLICRVIKPAPAGVMKYLWFTGVALSIIAEGISAAVTGEALDLIIVGTASFGIFIYAFIRRNRLWFILGIVSMISIAVYLSLEFWSSLVWLIYLLVAGSILIVMAAVNEWGKRHNPEGKKKRFFEEWTW